MAVSKRLRYEIFRRDGHACRYCGSSAPDVKLTVDHVIPVTLGGGDDPENLVTACTDCNAGKSSVPADAAFVADVNEQALLWRQLTEAAATQLRDERLAGETFIAAAADLWDRFCPRWQMPIDGLNTLSRFYTRGVTLEDVEYAAMVTASTRGVAYHWSYFCGIINKHLKQRDERAQEMYQALHQGDE